MVWWSHGLWGLVVLIVVVFECGGWDVAAVLVGPVVVVPVDSFGGGQFQVVGVVPWAVPFDQFGLV